MPSGSVQVSRNTKVASLINPVSGEWDIDFLKPFISSAKYEAILATHLGDPELRDRLIWPFDKRGIYSVKSGYHWVHSRGIPQTNSKSSSSLTILVTLWKLLWQLKTPPKIRCFMWKTVHNALATMAALYHRKSASSPLCHLCNTQEEMIEHLLVLCLWVETIWFGGILNYKVNQEEITTWTHWILAISSGHAKV